MLRDLCWSSVCTQPALRMSQTLACKRSLDSLISSLAAQQGQLKACLAINTAREQLPVSSQRPGDCPDGAPVPSQCVREGAAADVAQAYEAVVPCRSDQAVPASARQRHVVHARWGVEGMRHTQAVGVPDLQQACQ